MSIIRKHIESSKKALNIYVTAGYPNLNDTPTIVKTLAKNGVSLIEIGMPFSDPLADGPTIQESSQIAINNGISLSKILEQIKEIREESDIPIILMGYYNQVLQYGDSKFFHDAKTVGVNGFILPDLPLHIYQKDYKQLFKNLSLDMVFLITPQTSDERIKQLDQESSGFLYVVSSYSITGSSNNIESNQIEYFNKLNNLNLNNKKLIGFGISNKETFNKACTFSDGAIIGSAFIKALKNSTNIEQTTKEFVQSILN